MSDCLCNNRLRPEEVLSNRRQFLSRFGMGFGALGLASLLSDELLAAAQSLGAPGKATHFPAKAKHVIHIFAQGAPSQVDTWDPKPELTKYHDQPFPASTAWRWRRRSSSPSTGKSGIEVSEVFSAMAAHVDDLAVIRSMQTDIPAHDVATVMMNTGSCGWRSRASARGRSTGWAARIKTCRVTFRCGPMAVRRPAAR